MLIQSRSVSGSVITPSSTLKSLGVVLDRSLSFDQHVAAVCKDCYFHIRALRQVRASLPEDVAKTVACSIIQSRLDYCNALFTGMSESNFKKLQRVQNTLARVVLRRGKYEHITPALAELHWLPIKQRVTFKIATTIFKIRYLHQPTYLLDLLNHYTPTRSLRSSSQLLLQTNPTRTVLSQRGFSSSAPRVWNSLPDKLRSCSTLDTFRRTLKTHLFSVAFDA